MSGSYKISSVSVNISNDAFSSAELLSYGEISTRKKQYNYSRLKSVIGNWVEGHWSKLTVDLNADSSKTIQHQVEFFVDKLLEELEDIDPRFAASKLGIGSFYSGTKKKPVDEFDFICQSKMYTTDVRFIHQHIPNTEVESLPKVDYFKVLNQHDGELQELNATAVRDRFRVLISVILMCHFPDCWMTFNGPAVSCLIPSFGGKKLKDTVKVDLTFGIPLEVGLSTNVWPLENSQVDADLEILEPVTPVHRGQITRCHFIPFGDIWRVSFAEYEGKLIQGLPVEKRNCFVALKVNKL